MEGFRVDKAKLNKKIKKVMGEMKNKKLHSGSKTGPLVKDPKVALAIAYSEAKPKSKKK